MITDISVSTPRMLRTAPHSYRLRTPAPATNRPTDSMARAMPANQCACVPLLERITDDTELEFITGQCRQLAMRSAAALR